MTRRSGAAALLFMVALSLTAQTRLERRLGAMSLPTGFRMQLYSGEVPGARSLVRAPGGTVFVGTRSGGGSVYAVSDSDGDHRADQVRVIARGLNSPNGVAVRDGALYVAEIHRVVRFDNIEDRLDDPPPPVVVTSSFPGDAHHGWKFIRFGPDGLLYVPVGAPCNICEPGDPYGAIHRMRPDGSGLEVFARGIRNTVGFDWHPQTGELWFTDNGRDLLGDNQPPDELNHAPEPGLHFGYPYLHGAATPDPTFGERAGARTLRPPAQELGPHVAALGMRFYTGSMFPLAYHNQIFIAEHGSWNRSVPIGYRITLVRLEGDRAFSYEPFAEGWLQGARHWGRPVDILVMPDGALLVSDDTEGAIYRISYSGSR